MNSKTHNLRLVRARSIRAGQIDAVEASIDRIDVLAAAGRSNWLALLAYLAFVLIATLAVEDIDFFVDSRQTELPLVGVSIPTSSFFVFAPILGSAFYAYLHIHIRKISEVLGAPPPGDPPFEERIRPWLLNDYLLRQRRDGAIRPRPLDRLADLTTLVLVWWAGPVVLALMWKRTWPAHALWLSLLCAACLMIAVYAGTLSWTKMQSDVGRRTKPNATVATLAVFLLCGPVVWLTVVNSKGFGAIGVSQHPRTGYFDTTRREKISIALRNAIVSLDRIDPPDLNAARISALPLDETDIDSAAFRYRMAFCERAGMPADVCGPAFPLGAAPNSVKRARVEWCHENDRNDCKTYFEDFEDGFSRAWIEHRTAQINEVPKPDLSGRDMRDAQLNGASLVGVTLENAMLDDAFMHQASLEGADLSQASLVDVFLLRAKLHRTDFGGAKLDDADLTSTTMHDTEFQVADLKGAKVSLARVDRADFSSANLQQASFFAATIRRSRFSSAKMRDTSLRAASIETSRFQGVDISDADFVGATITASAFRNADLRSTVWWRASVTASYMHGADLRGATGFSQRIASTILGSPKTLLPVDPDPDTGQPIYVISCWPEAPEGWDLLVAWFEQENWASEAGMRKDLLCSPGELPKKTGTPWPLDKAPPWETDPDWQPEDRGVVNP